MGEEGGGFTGWACMPLMKVLAQHRRRRCNQLRHPASRCWLEPARARSHIDTFVHDPLVEWVRSSSHNGNGNGGGSKSAVAANDEGGDNPHAKDALATIEGGSAPPPALLSWHCAALLLLPTGVRIHHRCVCFAACSPVAAAQALHAS